jgi:hypothetical protein
MGVYWEGLARAGNAYAIGTKNPAQGGISYSGGGGGRYGKMSINLATLPDSLLLPASSL